MQNEDVLRRMNRNRDKLDSVVSKYYFNKDNLLHKDKADVSEHQEFVIEEWDQIDMKKAYSKFDPDLFDIDKANPKEQADFLLMHKVIARIQKMVRGRLAKMRVAKI
jgi:hypothetical protein